MHHIEPYFLWMDHYRAADDPDSPFFGRQYSELYFTHKIYNHIIHPQWDEFGSDTLFLKILFADYTDQYVILEFIGEWNDCINNDIMHLKRNVIDHMIDNGIRKFILIGENVLNVHPDDDSYYEEWFQDVEDGWVALINFQPHVLEEMSRFHLDYFLNYGGDLDDLPWRALQPEVLFKKLDKILMQRLGA